MGANGGKGLGREGKEESASKLKNLSMTRYEGGNVEKECMLLIVKGRGICVGKWSSVQVLLMLLSGNFICEVKRRRIGG